MTAITAERQRLALKRADLFREQAFVGGEWIGSTQTISVDNPATGGALGTIPNLDGVAATEAVDAAAAAFPAWKALTAKDRSKIMRKWFDLILKHQDDLARLLTAEQGKPLAEAQGEIAYAASFIEWFAEEAKRTYGDTIPGHLADKRLTVIKQPVGVVGAVTPWNFPAAMITRKVAPALAVGCTVVLKPSELTPYSALALAVLAEEAGFPAGVFNVVTGEAPPIGAVLTGDPRVRKFTFTGSTPVGKRLAAQCAATVKRVSLELGGNAPFLVFDDADIDRAVSGAITSKFRNTGQTCVCANRFLVQAGIYDAFAAALSAAAAKLVVGDGLAGATEQGPLINRAAVDKVERHVADALQKGATVRTGGKRLPSGELFYAPTVLTGVTPEAELFTEETFGPLAALIRFETEAEGIALANDSTAGLAAYVYSNSLDRYYRVSEALEFGMVGFNTGLISTEVAPFGGVKESGYGREGSLYGIDDFLSIKLICTDVKAG